MQPIPISILIACLSVLIFFATSANSAANAPTRLPREEVNALMKIAKGLGKTDWDFNIDPCSGNGTWKLPIFSKGVESSVTCDCTFHANSSCHITMIALKGQNLTGNVPPEFAKFPYLSHLDLSRNNLRGSVPPQWASMNLVDLSVMGNRLQGPFPTVLTSITSLVNLSIEGNQFSGPIPQTIGKLVNLQKLILSSNQFSGDLPAALAMLTNLTDMRISDNNFTGRIPDFISSWTKIEKLHIQGCSLEGPIPSTISTLTQLGDLRISDLKGQGSTFPPLGHMESLKILILRKCSVHGEIPAYLGEMEKLKTLDLSFNNLSGEIPATFTELGRVDYMYLTGNQLRGQIPDWILNRNKNIDVSYNNFTWGGSSPVECPRGSVNLVESYSAAQKFGSRVHPCLKRDFPCSDPAKQQHYSLHINCGGKEMTNMRVQSLRVTWKQGENQCIIRDRTGRLAALETLWTTMLIPMYTFTQIQLLSTPLFPLTCNYTQQPVYLPYLSLTTDYA